MRWLKTGFLVLATALVTAVGVGYQAVPYVLKQNFSFAKAELAFHEAKENGTWASLCTQIRQSPQSDASICLDAGEGRDTFTFGSGGPIFLDGQQVARVEIYEFTNGQVNRIHILADALALAEGKHVVVRGDSGQDVVHFHDIVHWNDPVVEVGNEGASYWRYVAIDRDGQKAVVDVEEGLRISANAASLRPVGKMQK